MIDNNMKNYTVQYTHTQATYIKGFPKQENVADFFDR